MILPLDFREDGRRFREMRHTKFALGYSIEPGFTIGFHSINSENSPDGHASIACGMTAVRSDVHGPIQLPGGGVRVAIHMSPNSDLTNSRKTRLSGESTMGERERYLSTLFTGCLESSSTKIGIMMHIIVVRNEGSVLSCCINAGILSLINAGIPLKKWLAAITVCRYTNEWLVDPTTKELDNAKPSILLVFDVLLLHSESSVPGTLELGTMEDDSDTHDNSHGYATSPDESGVDDSNIANIEGILLENGHVELSKIKDAIQIGMDACSLICKLMKQEVREDTRRRIVLLSLLDEPKNE